MSDSSPIPESRVFNCTWMRYGLMSIGIAATGLGILGAFLPVMPSTVFFLIALWAFSKSSLRMHRWLFTHPRFGHHLRAWHVHRVIPRRAKILAVSMMAASFLFVTVFVAKSWFLPTILAAVLGTIAAYIVTRASTVQDTATSEA